MKKFLAIVMALCLVLSMAACSNSNEEKTTEATTAAPEVTVMSYADYVAADLESEVTIEAYVQATQSWWDNVITVYAQDKDGAYFLYEMACSEEDAAKLVPGTKIRVNGFKGEWAGEVEVMDGTFEFVEGADTYIAPAVDLTDKLGTDELVNYQNQFVSFTGLTVEGIEYKNGEPGDDIYVTVGKDGASYSFCVERYLTDPETEVYKAVGELKAGDVADFEGFLYWYEGVNTHITAVKNVVAAPAVMTYAEYAAADLDTEVTIEAYVQATQSWWDNKITVYAQDKDGAYFLYEMACSEEDAAKLVPGTKIRVNGYKAEWAGEVEIVDATFEFAGNDTFIAEAVDVTDKLGTDELVNYQNQYVLFTDLTVEGIEYKNGEPGDDIYVTVGKDGASYSFCVERYLTDPETEVYKAVGELKAGDVIDVNGFLYWYEGVNTHITAVTVK